MMRLRHLMTGYSKVTVLLFVLKDIPKLMIEFCKYLYCLSAFIMKVFTKRILMYNLQTCKVLSNPKTKKCGSDTVAY